MPSPNDWFFWALLSAVFAATTAILAKVGIESVDADNATFVRTLVVLSAIAVALTLTGKWQNPFSFGVRSNSFLVLSGLATGASWICYFRALKLGDASKVAPVDKLSIVLVAVFATVFLAERPSSREWLGIGMIGIGVVVLGLKK